MRSQLLTLLLTIAALTPARAADWMARSTTHNVMGQKLVQAVINSNF